MADDIKSSIHHYAWREIKHAIGMAGHSIGALNMTSFSEEEKL